MRPHKWSKLSPLQLGRYAEYLVKMEFTLYGFDVFSSEVDERGIDFVIRKDTGVYYEVQVKSCRNRNYIYFPKDKFVPRPTLLAAIVLFEDDRVPDHFLIPSIAWLHPNTLLIDRDYEGKKSKPEWGLVFTKKSHPILEGYRFDKTVKNL